MFFYNVIENELISQSNKRYKNDYNVINLLMIIHKIPLVILWPANAGNVGNSVYSRYVQLRVHI